MYKKMEGMELLVMKPRWDGFKPDPMDQVAIDEDVVRIGELMGNTREDLVKYGCKGSFAESEAEPVDQVTIDENVLRVAEMMGNTEEDLKKYA